VADVTPERLRGAAYGLRQALDTAGAVGGPLFAVVLMAVFAGDIRSVFWVAFGPALAAVALLALFVREPAAPERSLPQSAVSSRPGSDVGRKTLGGLFWAAVGVGAILTLARFSDAFLLLRAQEAGLPVELLPVVLIVMNAVYGAAAYPAGAMSDRVGRVPVLAAAAAVLACADIIVAFAPDVRVVMFGAGMWGLSLALSQGILVALVADATTRDLRGTALGVFHVLNGLALLLSSVAAGALWDRVGSSVVFLLGAGCAGAGLVALAALARREKKWATGA
jgi:MFS family permease